MLKSSLKKANVFNIYKTPSEAKLFKQTNSSFRSCPPAGAAVTMLTALFNCSVSEKYIEATTL